MLTLTRISINIDNIRDYASSGGFWRETRALLLPKGEEDDSAFDDDLYTVYIDVTSEYNGVGRFFSGVLIDDSKASMKQTLLESNMNSKASDHISYEIGDLPSVKSAVVQFPWTDGFVSALMHNYKVFPALYRYAKKNFPEGQKFIVSTSCNRKKQVCTHYVPMVQEDKFLLGHEDTANYEGFEDDQLSIDFEMLTKGFKKIFWGFREVMWGKKLKKMKEKNASKKTEL